MRDDAPPVAESIQSRKERIRQSGVDQKVAGEMILSTISIWENATSIHFSESALRYFAACGLSSALPLLTPEIARMRTENVLLFRIENPDDLLVGLQRTSLTDDGNLKFTDASPTLFKGGGISGYAGSAIKLFSATTDTLVIAQDIESALALRLMTPTTPVWSAITGRGFKEILVPEHIRTIHLAVNLSLDGKARKEADIAAETLSKGREVFVSQPPKELARKHLEDGHKTFTWCHCWNLVGALQELHLERVH